MKNNKKLKILYLVTQSEMGGAQKYIFNLATALKEEFDVIVGAGGQGELLNELAKNGVRTINLYFSRSISNPIKVISELIKLIIIIKKIRPDIVHLNSSKMGVVGSIAAKIAGVKKVFYTVHGFVFNEPMPKVAKKFYIYIEKLSAYFKDKLICVSEFDKSQGIKFNIAKSNKLTVVHNGINTNLNFMTKDEARKKLNIHATNVIGTIANFYPTKNLLTLIQAIPKIKEKFPNIKLIIIGDGLQKKLILNQITELSLDDNVILIGQKENAYKYLPAFDIYVCTSVKEGFPLSILEAMLAELPIVSTNVGGIPEMITNDYSGMLVDPKKPNLLAEKVNKLTVEDDNAKRLGKAAKKIVLEKFNLQNMVKNTKTQYLK
ncbi:glycosyltransferase family 4 protein [Patescibacteria group bacterium]|nr:glycosyltransferase family 4 protein [Patescibacteria group bacterium]